MQLAYGRFGNGVEFFPKIEPDFGLVQVHARGNLSIHEKDQLVREVEQRLLGNSRRLKTVYARVGEQPRGSSEVTEDTVGMVQFEFVDWQERRQAHVIMDEIRAMTSDIPGILIEVTKPRADPPTGKPITLQIAVARSRAAAPGRPQGRRDRRAPDADLATSTTACRCPASTGSSRSTRPRPPSTAPASAPSAPRSSSSPTASKITEYRPSTTDKSVDILVRFPPERRSLDELDELRVQTPAGHVPIGNFVAAHRRRRRSATSTASPARAS